LPRISRSPRKFLRPRSEGGKAVFVQTLRARTPGVREIPPIEFSYFDTKDGTFKVARTEAMPIHVDATRVVTAWDAEGSASRPEAKELKTFAGGISATARKLDALVPQAFGSSGLLFGAAGWLLVLLPPLLFAALLIALKVRERREADPLAFRARGAGRRLLRALQATGRLPEAETHAAVLKTFRDYLGSKLKLPAAALTFAEVDGPLEKRGVPTETRALLKT